MIIVFDPYILIIYMTLVVIIVNILSIKPEEEIYLRNMSGNVIVSRGIDLIKILS